MRRMSFICGGVLTALLMGVVPVSPALAVDAVDIDNGQGTPWPVKTPMPIEIHLTEQLREEGEEGEQYQCTYAAGGHLESNGAPKDVIGLGEPNFNGCTRGKLHGQFTTMEVKTNGTLVGNAKKTGDPYLTGPVYWEGVLCTYEYKQFVLPATFGVPLDGNVGIMVGTLHKSKSSSCKKTLEWVFEVEFLPPFAEAHNVWEEQFVPYLGVIHLK